MFGDALRRLAAAATYLYQDGPRYWYSTQPTVTKLAEDRAEQLKRDPDKVVQELDKRLRADLRKMGDFKRVHPMPSSSADVPDDLDARLVVLGVDHAYTKDPDNHAERAAKAIFERRGTRAALISKHDYLSCRRQESVAGLGRGCAQTSRVGIHPRPEEYAGPLTTSGEAGRDADDGSRRHCDGQASRNVPVVAGTNAGEPASTCNVANRSPFRERRTRGACQ